jgi:cytochrome c5
MGMLMQYVTQGFKAIMPRGLRMDCRIADDRMALTGRFKSSRLITS